MANARISRKSAGSNDGRGAQRFEVAGAGRLQMDEPARQLGGNAVDAELVRPGVQAELVRPERPGDGRMAGKVASKASPSSVADVVDALLEAADVTRGQADPAHAQAAQLARDEEVLGVGGGGVGLVDRHLQLDSRPPGRSEVRWR